MSVIDEGDAPAARSNTDAVCVALGRDYFIAPYRFTRLFVESPAGRSPRLAVSRYYWDLTPPVAVDFVRDISYGEAELEVKKAYFASRNIRYLLVKDAWDGEGAEKALLRYLSDTEQARVTQNAAKPLTGPRRSQSA